MNTSALTSHEKELLVQAVGGPSAARAIIRGSKIISDRFPRFAEVVVGVAYSCDKRKTIYSLSDKGYLKDKVIEEVILSRAYTLSTKRLELKLAVVCPDQLGLTDGATYADIVKMAKKYDLVLCPKDTATALMLQMSVAWTSGSYVVASEPIMLHTEAYLFRASDRRLMLAPGDKGHHWEPYDNFLFRKL